MQGLRECDNSIERIFTDDVELSLKLRGMNDVDFIALGTIWTSGLYSLT